MKAAFTARKGWRAVVGLAIEVVSLAREHRGLGDVYKRQGQVHHLHSTAGQTEGHRPKGALTSPVRNGVHGRAGVCQRMRSQLSNPEYLFTYSAYCMTPLAPS